MVAERIHLQNERGQSILEVVFVLPFLFVFVGLLYKVTMAVQMAINNTQYARSQLYMLTSNSAEYPRLEFRVYQAKSFVMMKQDKMVLGVADPEQVDFSDPNGQIDPVPQIQKIGRANTTIKGSAERGEVKRRTDIRVRNTAAICTQLNSMASNKPMNSDTIPGLMSQRWPFKQKVCAYQGEGSI